jgi:hypothetical protein
LEWLAKNLSNAGDAFFLGKCGKEGRLGDLPAVHPILFTHVAEFQQQRFLPKLLASL